MFLSYCLELFIFMWKPCPRGPHHIHGVSSSISMYLGITVDRGHRAIRKMNELVHYGVFLQFFKFHHQRFLQCHSKIPYLSHKLVTKSCLMIPSLYNSRLLFFHLISLIIPSFHIKYCSCTIRKHFINYLWHFPLVCNWHGILNPT